MSLEHSPARENKRGSASPFAYELLTRHQLAALVAREESWSYKGVAEPRLFSRANESSRLMCWSLKGNDQPPHCDHKAVRSKNSPAATGCQPFRRQCAMTRKRMQ